MNSLFISFFYQFVDTRRAKMNSFNYYGGNNNNGGPSESRGGDRVSEIDFYS